MLPGIFDTSVTITDKRLTLVGVGASQIGQAQNAFVVGSGADVTIRGLTIDLSRGDFRCDPSAGAQPPILHLQGVKFHGPSSGRMVRLVDCRASLESVQIESGALNLLAIENGSVVTIDRSSFVSTGSGGAFSLFGSGKSMVVTLTNSLFIDTSVFFTLGPNVQHIFRMAFSTLVKSGTSSIMECSNTSDAVITLENNVFSSPLDPIYGAGCTLQNNVIYLQSSAVPGNNIIQDPRFVDPSTRDFRLKADSPAVDKAIPGLVDTDHDFRGAPRPVGLAKDIGAFERVP